MGHFFVFLGAISDCNVEFPQWCTLVETLLWNVHCVATVVLRKQLNFKSLVIRSKRSSCSP